MRLTSISILLAVVCLMPSLSFSDVVAHYKFDEGNYGSQASFVVDSGPNGYHGAAGQSGATPVYRVGVNGGNSLEFLPQFGSSFVEVADPGNYALDLTGPLTIEAFIHPTEIFQNHVIVRKYGGLGGGGGGPGGYYLAKNSDGRLIFTLFDDAITLYSNSVLEPRFQHVAATWDGLTMRIYIDYQLEGSMPYTGPLNANNSKFGIGALIRDSGSVGQVFRGRIDEVRISDQALTRNQFIQRIDYPVDSLSVTRGNHVAGTLSDLSISDNFDVIVQRNAADIQSRVFIEYKGASPVPAPSSLSFRLEAAVFARSTVNQSIDLYDYDSNTWVEIDIRPANQNTDIIVIADATGELSRFVESGTNSVTARSRFNSISQRQRFSANVDFAVFLIDD